MAFYDRSIKIAFDKISGEILEADEIFEVAKDAFTVRRQFHKDEVELFCCECDQKLNVSTSKNDRLHFKHNPNADYCILKDGNLSPKESEQFNKIILAKESPRHKELKNKIGNLLLNVEGVEKGSIAVDNKFIIHGTEKRRPDVYCKYFDKEIVFEIQLSNLSLRYILSRYDFYKKHGIYLIWILDNFDIHNQGQLERDIKYLTRFENFFKLDENTDIFKLDCQYKFPFLTENNKLHTKWLNISVPLNQVKFDPVNYQIYYFDFDINKSKTETEMQHRVAEIQAAERQQLENKRLSDANYYSEQIIEKIRDFRKRKMQSFTTIINMIDALDDFELDVLNTKLKIRNRDKSKTPALIEWVLTAKKEDIAFIDFILNCHRIEMDVNQKTADGKTIFQTIYENDNIHNYFPIKGILKRGYQIIVEDEIYINKLGDNNKDRKEEVLKYAIIKRLTDRNLVDDVYKHSKLIFIIESALRNEIVGFNYKPDQWIAFANNAIQYHSEYWEYIELAFKNYGLWTTLINLDKKKTFENKLQEFYKTIPKQKFDFDSVCCNLYPDIAF